MLPDVTRRILEARIVGGQLLEVKNALKKFDFRPALRSRECLQGESVDDELPRVPGDSAMIRAPSSVLFKLRDY